MRRAKCLECFFFGGRTHTCDYFLLTGERRGCQPADCTKYKPRYNKRKIMSKRAFESSLQSSGAIPQELLPQVRELYNKGLYDIEIACRLQLNSEQVSRWRRRKGLISNYIGGMYDEHYDDD